MLGNREANEMDIVLKAWEARGLNRIEIAMMLVGTGVIAIRSIDNSNESYRWLIDKIISLWKTPVESLRFIGDG